VKEKTALERYSTYANNRRSLKKNKTGSLGFRNPLGEVIVLLDYDATLLGNWFPDVWRQSCGFNLAGRNFQDEDRRRFGCLNIWRICDNLSSDTPLYPRRNYIENCRIPTRETTRKTDRNVCHNLECTVSNFVNNNFIFIFD
jgi:hypothetical protein